MMYRKVMVLGVLGLVALFLLPGTALAQEGGGAAAGRGLLGLGVGLGLGIAALGSALGQGLATAAAMESIGRNPNSTERLLTPLILGLALMEALTLYMFVIAFFLLGKI